MTVKLSGLLAGCPLSPGRFLVLISVTGWVDPRAIVWLEGLGKLKKNHLIWTRTRDLPAYTACPLNYNFAHNMHVDMSVSTAYSRPTVCLPSRYRICWILWISFRKKMLGGKFFLVVICLELYSLKQQKSACSRHSDDVECIVTELPPYV
jgi:hypothetical protein